MSRSLSNEMKRLIGFYRKDKCINVVAPVVLHSTHCGRLILLVGRVTRSCTCAVYARRVRVRSVRRSESCETALIRLPIVSLPCSCPAQPSPARPYRVETDFPWVSVHQPLLQKSLKRSRVSGVITTRLLQGMCRVKMRRQCPVGLPPCATPVVTMLVGTWHQAAYKQATRISEAVIAHASLSLVFLLQGYQPIAKAFGPYLLMSTGRRCSDSRIKGTSTIVEC